MIKEYVSNKKYIGWLINNILSDNWQFNWPGMTLVSMYAIRCVPITSVRGIPDIWTTNNVVNQNSSKSYCGSKPFQIILLNKKQFITYQSKRARKRSFRASPFNKLQSNGVLENFVSSLVWINTIQWDARKHCFLACLDK